MAAVIEQLQHDPQVLPSELIEARRIFIQDLDDSEASFADRNEALRTWDTKTRELMDWLLEGDVG